MIGEFETEMMREFFLAVANNAQMNLHIRKLDGFNNHHLAEASFKAFAKALDMATSVDPRITDVLSTKGTL
jgi:imidazoleglycerol-phosphate dehydratase